MSERVKNRIGSFDDATKMKVFGEGEWKAGSAHGRRMHSDSATRKIICADLSSNRDVFL